MLKPRRTLSSTKSSYISFHSGLKISRSSLYKCLTVFLEKGESLPRSRRRLRSTLKFNPRLYLFSYNVLISKLNETERELVTMNTSLPPGNDLGSTLPLLPLEFSMRVSNARNAPPALLTGILILLRKLTNTSSMPIMATSQIEGNDNEATSAASRQKDRQARKYGFACANCRRRKVRCDGALPNCQRCVTSKLKCCFNK
jgi:Fungal Zn(2)-Cys(6) binuclear cluster domain